VRAFKSKDFSYWQLEGVYTEGETYVFVKEEDGKAVYATSPYGWIILQASKIAIVIGLSREKPLSTDAVKGMEVVVKHLGRLDM